VLDSVPWQGSAFHCNLHWQVCSLIQGASSQACGLSTSRVQEGKVPRHCRRWGMWTPGIIGLVIGVLLLFSIKDDPETAGYPPIDEPAKSEHPLSRFARPVHTHNGAYPVQWYDSILGF
jgi:sugar phosphate permease